MLSDLLARADARVCELAKAYNRARIAGLTCEAFYSALTHNRRASVKRTIDGLLEAGEPLILKAIVALRRYHEAQDGNEPPVQVERQWRMHFSPCPPA